MCFELPEMSNDKTTNEQILYNLCILANSIDSLSFDDEPDYKGYIKLLWNIEQLLIWTLTSEFSFIY